MSNLNQTQPKKSGKVSLQEFPTILSKQPQPKKETIPIQTQPKITIDDFPTLGSESILSVSAPQKQEIPSVQAKKQQKFENEYPSIVSKPKPIFELGTKQVWETPEAKKKTNLNRSYQVPKTQAPLTAMLNNSASRKPKPLNTLVLNNSHRLETEQRDRRSSTSELSDKFINSSSDSDNENESESNENWPDFEQMKYKIKKFQQFKVPLCFPTVKHYRFEKAPDQDYSTHYEKARVHKYFEETSENNKWAKWTKMGKFRILCINCDFNIPSRNGNDKSCGTDDSDSSSEYKRIVKEYWRTTQQERAKQIVHQIRLAIFQGVDFICLQEICQPTIRKELLKALEALKNTGQNQYFFPKNLESHEFIRTTMILSKYPVKFGHLQFQIPEHENQDQTKFYFPLQAFCEFEIMIGRKVLKVGILTCHLRSNGEKNSSIRPHKMRKMQIRCIHDFSKRFDKFFCIGDTNIPSSEKFKNQNIWIKRRFVDAFDVGQSAIGGTYMYRTKANVVREQRMDRVWMKKDMKANTDVQITFREVLLESCKNKGFNKKEMLDLDEQKLIYISPSDHEILDINIQFTKYE